VFSLDSAHLADYYEVNTDDYRYLYWYKDGDGVSILSRYLLKYAASASTESYYQNKMPVLKLSEMYFILAECDYHDGRSILNDLNPIRTGRGIKALANEPAPGEVRTVLTTEYRKEFLGEGQMFYYFKRLNQRILPGSDKDMPAIKAYIFPLPASEYDAANRLNNR